MNRILDDAQRKLLDRTVRDARVEAEAAAADALVALAVNRSTAPAYLTTAQNVQREGLRAKAKQLGDPVGVDGAQLTLLVREVAYEQWHRLLFARFLAENELLRHPDFPDVAVTLTECDDLAAELGEPDGWSVAARFASQILPGVFRLDDPAHAVRFSPERRLALEALLDEVPAAVFQAEDALGWVYQYWQTAEKKRVNESGRKIGGADLSPVTQLFTENYMVRFLLENSLGAWWAARHPDSPLVGEWEYLRRLDDGTPAAGTFEEWPATAAEVTVMDPCCGSGHFLVAMFGMLWRMRAEEEGRAPAEAQDAVLRDNLFGLELDPRCTQIATFNVALEAWKQGGFRDLPAPQIACSGIPVRGTRGEWEALASDDDQLRTAMIRLHTLFRNADTLGSLIDPVPDDARDTSDGMFGRDLTIGVDWVVLRDLLSEAMQREGRHDTVLGHVADDVFGAASLLGRTYTLIATNPPWLGSQRMAAPIAKYIEHQYPQSALELAMAMLQRFLPQNGGTIAAVTPLNWLFLKTFSELREHFLEKSGWNVLAPLGDGAFPGISGQVVQGALVAFSGARGGRTLLVDAREANTASAKADLLALGAIKVVEQDDLIRKSQTLLDIAGMHLSPLSSYASSWQGLVTMDSSQFVMKFWETSMVPAVWERLVVAPSDTGEYTGRENVLRWDGGNGALRRSRAHNYNPPSVLGKRGVLVAQSSLRATLYRGEMFNHASAPVIPIRAGDLPAMWAFIRSDEYKAAVRRINSKVMVDPGYLIKVGFDRERWQSVADEAGALPEPQSDDPTQWLFKGDVAMSTQPLQVAVARLLGYRWPDQTPDERDAFADADGIVALPSLPGGEGDAASRLRTLLAAAYGDAWSTAVERRLVTEAGTTSGRLDDWLWSGFFAQHCKVFDNRPFLWHISDGRKDGFSAIVNYHRLDRPTLEKLTYTTLGAWLERQGHEVAEQRAGADKRLAAAEELQDKLKLILEGAPPYDVYVRWKELHEQPIGWEPDLDDGVRLNIRPFVTAGVLRSRVNVHWKKDRGTNPDGSERHNDLHPTLEERRAARRQHELEART